MGELHIKAILAGMFFVMWPLLMNRSGLNPGAASGVLAFFSLVVILPFALYDVRGMIWPPLWYLGAVGGVCAALGTLVFSGVLSKVSKQDVGSFFVLVLVTQIVVGAAYQTYVSGGLTISKAIGFIGAIIVAILLA